MLGPELRMYVVVKYHFITTDIILVCLESTLFWMGQSIKQNGSSVRNSYVHVHVHVVVNSKNVGTGVTGKFQFKQVSIYHYSVKYMF